MQIICVSRGSYSKGKEVAESLAKKLDCQCVSREELVEEAIDRGIAVGKLEMSMLKPHIFTEKLVLEKEHYQAFSTVYLMERALKKDLLYHGRTGHLLFPRIGNLLRVRVVAGLEYRIGAAMRRFNMNREQAKNYVENIDGDIRRWVRMFYGVDPDVALHYDVIFNMEQMSVENASSALCNISQLPEFQVTPATFKAIDNLLVASRARLALAEHDLTYNAQFMVRAESGVVSVAYQPHQAYLANDIPKILKSVEGVREVICTIAQTHILWIQERYDPKSESFRELISLSQKWEAAVELLRLSAVDDNVYEVKSTVDTGATHVAGKEKNGGVEDDVEEKTTSEDDGGMKQTATELVNLGHFGGERWVRTTPQRVLEAIDHGVKYSLVVLGDLFLAKGHAARGRMCRELSTTLQDKLKVPVVMADELRQQFLFSPRHMFQLVFYVVLTAVVYWSVFTHQVAILEFLQGNRMLAAASVFAFVPAVAYIYGNAARLFLKMLRIE